MARRVHKGRTAPWRAGHVGESTGMLMRGTGLGKGLRKGREKGAWGGAPLCPGHIRLSVRSCVSKPLELMYQMQAPGNNVQRGKGPKLREGAIGSHPLKLGLKSGPGNPGEPSAGLPPPAPCLDRRAWLSGVLLKIMEGHTFVVRRLGGGTQSHTVLPPRERKAGPGVWSHGESHREGTEWMGQVSSTSCAFHVPGSVPTASWPPPSAAEAPGGRHMECVLDQGIPSRRAMPGTQRALHDSLWTGCDIHQSSGRSASSSSSMDEEAAAQRNAVTLPSPKANESQGLNLRSPGSPRAQCRRSQPRPHAMLFVK